MCIIDDGVWILDKMLRKVKLTVRAFATAK